MSNSASGLANSASEGGGGSSSAAVAQMYKKKICQERLNGWTGGSWREGSGVSPLCWANWRQWFTTQSAHTAPHACTSTHTVPPTALPHNSPYRSPTYRVPPHSSPHNSPYRSPTYRVPPHSSPHSPQGTARPTGTGEGAKHISRSEECEQCEGAHEYTLPAHKSRGCPMSLTAANSLHVATV